MNLLEDGSFRPAGEPEALVPDAFSVNAKWLRSDAALPEPFQSRLGDRNTHLIYIEQAGKQRLLKRLLGQLVKCERRWGCPRGEV